MLGLWRLRWVLKGLWFREEVLALWVTDDRGCFQGTHLCDCVEPSHGAPFSHSQYQWSFSFNTDNRISSFPEITGGPLGFTGREEKSEESSEPWVAVRSCRLNLNEQKPPGDRLHWAGLGRLFCWLWVARALLEALREGLAGRLYLLSLDASPVRQPSLYNVAFIW